MFLIIDEDFAAMNGLFTDKCRFKRYLSDDEVLSGILMKIDNIKIAVNDAAEPDESLFGAADAAEGIGFSVLRGFSEPVTKMR